MLFLYLISLPIVMWAKAVFLGEPWQNMIALDRSMLSMQIDVMFYAWILAAGFWLTFQWWSQRRKRVSFA